MPWLDNGIGYVQFNNGVRWPAEHARAH